MTAGVNPFRSAKPRVTAFDDSDRMGAGFDAWSLWLNASALAMRPEKDFGVESRSYMKKTIEVLTAKLRRMK